jgi:ppGpp synthetase/RelA/SpoT-type nucleotidyltranferase
VSDDAQLGRSTIDRLGRRLRSGDTISDDDVALLEAFRERHQRVLFEVDRRLRDELGLEATTRVKTVNTLIEKLQRESHLALSSVQDIAGARVVVPNGIGQFEVATSIESAFGGRISERRAATSAGYSALHVLARIEGCHVEIQVRTELQDAWANLFEGLADRWGRQIRYGGDPDDPGRILEGDVGQTRAALIADLQKAGEAIEEVAALERDLEKTKEHIAEGVATRESIDAQLLVVKPRRIRHRLARRRLRKSMSSLASEQQVASETLEDFRLRIDRVRAQIAEFLRDLQGVD